MTTAHELILTAFRKFTIENEISFLDISTLNTEFSGNLEYNRAARTQDDDKTKRRAYTYLR